jgi:hypothetical protein
MTTLSHGTSIHKPARARSVKIRFDAAQIRKLASAASRRDIATLEMITARILFVVLRDNLIDAVLDDGDSAASPYKEASHPN